MRIGKSRITGFRRTGRCRWIDTIAAPLKEVAEGKSTRIAPVPTGGDRYRSGVTPQINWVSKVSSSVVVLAKLVRRWIGNLSAGPLRAHVLSTPYIHSYFWLGPPKVACEGDKDIIVNYSRRAANPDRLVLIS